MINLLFSEINGIKNGEAFLFTNSDSEVQTENWKSIKLSSMYIYNPVVNSNISMHLIFFYNISNVLFNFNSLFLQFYIGDLVI